jgi:hypothetical protein
MADSNIDIQTVVRQYPRKLNLGCEGMRINSVTDEVYIDHFTSPYCGYYITTGDIKIYLRADLFDLRVIRVQTGCADILWKGEERITAGKARFMVKQDQEDLMV